MLMVIKIYIRAYMTRSQVIIIYSEKSCFMGVFSYDLREILDMFGMKDIPGILHIYSI